VRELRNCLERSVIFCDSAVLNIACLPEQYRKPSQAGPDDDNGFASACRDDGQEGLLRGLYDNVCKELILETLKKNGGSRQKTAEQLGINRRTLYNKIKKLAIE
jgi:DNA-binding NtrC family response regulator